MDCRKGEGQHKASYLSGYVQAVERNGQVFLQSNLMLIYWLSVARAKEQRWNIQVSKVKHPGEQGERPEVMVLPVLLVKGRELGKIPSCRSVQLSSDVLSASASPGPSFCALSSSNWSLLYLNQKPEEKTETSEAILLLPCVHLHRTTPCTLTPPQIPAVCTALYPTPHTPVHSPLTSLHCVTRCPSPLRTLTPQCP